MTYLYDPSPYLRGQPIKHGHGCAQLVSPPIAPLRRDYGRADDAAVRVDQVEFQDGEVTITA